MIGIRQYLATLAFIVLVPVMSVLSPALTQPAAAHDDPLEDKLALLNSLPPDIAPDRSDLQIVGLESWLAPNWLTARTPVPDIHKHRFLFWSYSESYLALPRRSIFNFADGVTKECGRTGSRYSPGAAGPPECGRDWFHTTAVFPMWMQTQMEYRVIRFTPWPRIYNKTTENSLPYLLDVGEIQAVGKEITAPTAAPLPSDTPLSIADCSLVDLSLGPCIAPGDIVDVTPVSYTGDWAALPDDDCADAEPVLMASIDAAAIQAAMMAVAAAAADCADGDGADDPDGGDPDGSDPDNVDPPDPDDTNTDGDGDPGDPPPTFESCDGEATWRGWLSCIRTVATDQLAAIAAKVYELLPAWAKAVVRALDGCIEFGEEALRAIWDAFRGAKGALTDFPEWLQERLAEIKELMDALKEDPEGFIANVLGSAAELDLYKEDKAKWVGKMACKVAAMILIPGGATKLVDDLRAWRKNRQTAGCNSFPTGTPVLMADRSHKPIEQVRPGDLVATVDVATGQWRTQAVLDQWSALDDGRMATAVLDGASSVTATDHHRFWVDDDGGWLPLDQVREGDHFLTPEGVTEVARLNIVDSGPTTVWELDVAVDDNFAVQAKGPAGGLDVLVHNCDFKRPDNVDVDQMYQPPFPTTGHRQRVIDELVEQARVRHGNDATFDRQAVEAAVIASLKGFQVHHVLPKQLRDHELLRDMDIDNIQNLRPLPCAGTACDLPTHQGPHDRYTTAVATMLDRINDSGLDDVGKRQAVGDLLDRLHDGIDGGTLPIRNKDGADADEWIDYLQDGPGLDNL
jgi:hypothetical protein